MSKQIINELPDHIKPHYDFIPYANWDDSEKGSRPAPYKLKQKYPEDHQLWDKSEVDRVGIRLNNLVLVDYDGNKPEAAGEIPTIPELATALGYDSQEVMFERSLIQWNEEFTSLHFLFIAPPDFNTTDFKRSNQGTTEHFWKHIDIKTENQLVYLKQGKTSRLLDPTTYDAAPQIVMDQLKRNSAAKTTATDFDYNHQCSDHQIKLAEEWLHEAVCELTNNEEGSRNATLNTLACTASGLVAGGALDNQGSYTLLYEAALKAGLDRSETINTLASAWEEGFKTPRRDAPYQKNTQTPEQAFASEVVHNTNVDIERDQELTESIKQGVVDPTDPDIGILHTQYVYFMENWVMNKEGRFINRNTLADFSKTAFNTQHLNMMPVKPGSKAFKKFIPSDVFEKANPIVVSDLMYKPGDEQIFKYEGVDYLNSYIPYEPERPSDDELNRMRTIVYNHLDWLFADPAHQRHILDWMAWQVQRTGEIVGWVPLIMGCLGDGKSVLFELLTAALGTRNTKSISNSSLNSDFQDWAVGAAVGAFEEIKIEEKKRKQVANDLKQFISETRIPVNGKGSKEKPMCNTMNFIAFTNESDSIYVTVGDRRWLILETNHFGKNNVVDRTQTDMQQHFDDIKSAGKDPRYAPVIHWVLREHEISPEFEQKLRYRAPQTVFSTQLNAQTVSEKENRLQEYLDNAHFCDGRQGRLIDHPDGFQVQDFRPVMPENWFQGMDKKPSAIILGKWLRNLGYEHANRLSTEGKQIKTFKKV